MEIIMHKDKSLHSVAALFDTPNEIIHAAQETVKAGYKNFDVHTPYPMHGMDSAMSLKPSKLGFVTLFFGVSGAAFILLFIFWTMSIDYPMVIGGKPFFSLPAFIPVTFETTVLLGGVATVLGMLAVFFNLPQSNHPLHDTEYMQAVSSDKYGVTIEAEDPHFDVDRITEFFKKLGAKKIQLVYFPELEIYPLFDKKFLGILAATAIVVSLGTYVTLNKLMYITPFDWMSEQDKVIPQEKSAFFSDGFGMRKPVEGTVARGFVPYPYKGIPEPSETLPNPLLPTLENLKMGQKKFLTYCSPCHGNFGDGDSRLRGQFPNPPTFHSERGRNMSDGMLYHIITNGQNIMPSYAPQTSREERWAIVNYIRVLQRAKNANIADLELINKESVQNVEN
jgi:hypothetical protein